MYICWVGSISRKLFSYRDEFSKLLGVSVRTLQRWDKKGLLVAYRTPTNRRYYTYEQYLKYMNRGDNNGDIHR